MHLAEEEVDLLGRRDIDVSYDWSRHVGRYYHEEFATGGYYQQLRGDSPGNYDVEELPREARDTLNLEQRRVYNAVMHHYKELNRVQQPQPLRLQVDGGGGTGKSYMVKVMSSHIQAEAARYGRSSPIVKAAPKGVASNQMGDQTLHSLLRLPGDGNYRPLSETQTVLNALQRHFRGTYYLVIDEKSMLGLKP
jgi:hypothetical protein